MYRGFELVLMQKFSDLVAEGTSQYNANTARAKVILDKYVLKGGVLDGSKLQDDWFPEIESNVFISHSHKDLNLAFELSGWLSKTFGLKSFIDHSVWGYGDELLRAIDEEYCTLPKPNAATFDYVKRNQSTSHIHTMLCAALSKMIFKSECIIFINTPNSISTKNDIENAGNKSQTESPWLFYEIATTKIVDKTIPLRLQMKQKKYGSETVIAEAEGFKMRHQADLSHLRKLNSTILHQWENIFEHQNIIRVGVDEVFGSPKDDMKKKAELALDVLYELVPPN